MFVFGLKKTQVGVTMALIVLYGSICPHSGYPHVAENENPTAAKDNVDNEEDQELFLDEDEALEEEQTALEEAADVEDDLTMPPRVCAGRFGSCAFAIGITCCDVVPKLTCGNFDNTGRTCNYKD